MAASDSIKERLELVLKARGWSPAELNRRAGFSTPTHVNTLLNRGAEKISAAALARIAAAASVQLQWLATGEGSMEYPPPDSAAPRLRNCNGYPEAVAGARVLRPQYGEHIWRAVGDAHPIATAPLVPGTLARIADIVAEFTPPPLP